MTSYEGHRGNQTKTSISSKGLWEPTILNNVETYANIPQIILNGPEWLTSIG